jgi:chromosome segregation ATPase
MIKTITYKRILNLGNYESKHLEMTYEIGENEDPFIEASDLMEVVESKIRKDQAQSYREEIESLLHELRTLKAQHRELLNEINTKQQELEEYSSNFTHPKYPDPDEDSEDGF